MRQNKLVTVPYTVSSEKIGKEFDGFRIAVLADLHDCTLGEGQRLLLSVLRRESPDVILIAGDLITEERRKRKVLWKNAFTLVKELVKLAPVYYGLGNHERRWQCAEHPGQPSFAAWKRRLEGLGVVFLDNSSRFLCRNGDAVLLTGLNLPTRCFARFEFLPWPRRREGKETVLHQGDLRRLIGRRNPDVFHILLAHTPEHASAYGAWGADLTLAGHYHGGIIRLPLVGGVIATSFRLFPKYDRGRFSLGRGEMIVSAGLGTHTIPLRPFNPPELVMVTLRRKA